MMGQLEAAQLIRIRGYLKRNLGITHDQLRDWSPRIQNGVQFKMFDFLPNSRIKAK
jgi:hypothetical protein